MADVSISYKGNEIASMNATGVKTLLTSSAFCEDDITVTYTKPAAPPPTLQTKSATYTPTTSQQTDSITADAGYDGLDEVNVTVNAMPSGSATTPATTITANPSISVSSGGLITASVSGSQSVTPTVSAGYVSSGTAGTVSVSGSNTSQLTTQAAQTIHPSATDQSIASGKYLTGTQTVKGVLLTNLSAGNIKKDVVVKVGDSTDDDCVTSVTGTYEGGGGTSAWHKLVNAQENNVATTQTSASNAFTIELGSSAYNKNQIIWVHIRDKAGKRDGYFYGSDVFFMNYLKANGATTPLSVFAIETFYCVGTTITGFAGQYGVYGFSINSDSGLLLVKRRYNSTYSHTIDGTYVTNVYALDLPDGLTLFD